MPHIQAFRGLRYNLAQVGSLGDVVAPPYDVIDGDFQQRLYDASPYNFVRLELTKEQPSDEDPAAVYERAATLFRQWIRDGVLQHEPDPAVYVYHQVFDHCGRTFTRRGFLTRIQLERFGEGNIYPHEQTHAKAKDDRLRLTRACKANMSPIFGLYPDPLNTAQNLLEAFVANKAALEAVDHLGVTHRLWPVSDPTLVGQVAALLDDKPTFVADGHHRFETACNYRDELAVAKGGSLPEDHPAQFVLAMLMSMDDPGLIVMPSHRLFSEVPELDASELSEKLTPVFECELAGQGPEAAAAVWQQIEEIEDQGVFGLFTAKDQRWTLVSATQATATAVRRLAPSHSEDWCGLGVAMLHQLIVDDLLGMSDHPEPKYVHRVSEVVDALQEQASGNEYQLAALVMPASVDDIRRISLKGERMPAKSTYFFPKLLSGLVVNPLDGN